jgi:hypothetical protein
MGDRMASRHSVTAAQAEELALQALLHLASEPERFGRFAALTGLDPASARAAAGEPGFLAGVLGFLLQDESELVAFAEAANIAPVRVPLAYRVIPGGDPALEINLDALR